MIDNKNPLHSSVRYFTLIVLLFSLVIPTAVVFADDTPPPPVEEVVDTPEQSGGETEAGSLSGNETPGEVVEGELTEDSSQPDFSDGNEGTDENRSQPQLIDQLPEGTDVVIVGEDGEVEPLATQEAEQAVVQADPIWCPDGETPLANAGGCSNSYSNMTDLLNALKGGGQPAQNGTIWIEKGYNSASAEPGGTTNITINGNTYTTWRDYSLTVQGGWNGLGTTTVDSSSPSTFSGDYFRILNWKNDVIVKDIIVEGAKNDDNLEVTTSGNVVLENVKSKKNKNRRGAVIDNRSGTGTVLVTNSSFTDNGSGSGADAGLQVLSKGNVTLVDVIATGNRDEGVRIDNRASTTDAFVQVNGTNLFTGNGQSGIYILSDGAVALNNITAENNKADGANIQNQTSSTQAGVTISGSNSFTGNTSDGLYVRSDGEITLSNVTANDNKKDSGVRLDNDEPGAGADVVINGTNNFNNNKDWGLLVYSRGDVVLQNITANNNKTQDGVYIDNDGGSGDVVLSGVTSFNDNGNGNGDDGLYIRTKGSVTLADLVATGNRDEGVEIYNAASTTSAPVQINGASIFTGNYGYGLYVRSKGVITLSNITAKDSKKDSGVILDNDEPGAGADVVINGMNNFNNNNDWGLLVYSRGDVDLQNITANNNKTQDGVYIDNDGGTGDVVLSGVTSFNGNGNGNNDDGLYIRTKGAVTLADVVATGNKDEGVEVYNTASTSSAAVQIGGTNVFTGNSGNGLNVFSKGNVILSNITADNNKGDGANLQNYTSSTQAVVTITGTNSFSNNTSDGVYARSRGVIMMTNVTADGNVKDSGARLDNNETGASADVIIGGSNSFSGNNDYGLLVQSRGSALLNDILANNNKTQDGIYIVNTNGSGDVSMTGTNSASINGNGNGDDGIYVRSKGAITLENITADNNKDDGADIYNGYSGTTSPVIINGSNSFSNNGTGANDDGLYISTRGNITLSNIVANNNQDDGADLRNSASSANAFVKIGEVNVFNGNQDDGLFIRSDGTITLNEVTANNNGAGAGDNGADLDNSSGIGDVVITGFHNSFSGNAGPGLDIDSKGNIDLYFATINNNNQVGGTAGALFDSSGVTTNSASVYCSIFKDNQGYGLDARRFRGSLTFKGTNTFSGNPSGDYRYNGTALFEDYNCTIPTASVPAGKKDGGKDKSDVLIIPVTGGQLVDISCDTPLTGFQLPEGDRVIFANLCGYQAVIEHIPQTALPDALPEGGKYISGLTVTLLRDGVVVDEIPSDASIFVEFKLLDNSPVENNALLYWDPAGNNGAGTWVDKDNFFVAGAYATAEVDTLGTYVMIEK